MFGLSQTFLEDVGIDSEVFDMMPEDMQQEQLLNFINQQQASLNTNRNNQGGNQPPIIDQQS